MLPVIARNPEQIEYAVSPDLAIEGKRCNVFQFATLFRPAEHECNFCTSCVQWCVTDALTLVEG